MVVVATMVDSRGMVLSELELPAWFRCEAVKPMLRDGLELHVEQGGEWRCFRYITTRSVFSITQSFERFHDAVRELVEAAVRDEFEQTCRWN